MEFAGKDYDRFITEIPTKKRAEEIAKQQRQLGFRARVVRMKLLDEVTAVTQAKSLWEVYTRY